MSNLSSAKKPVFTDLNEEKIELGKKLYFDPRLSFDGTISCNSCHNLSSNGSDHRPHSIGIKGQHGGRKSPTVWNAALMSSLFWDGRAATLEAQAVGPITNPIEMGMPDEKTVVKRLSQISGYTQEFEKVYGKKTKISLERIGDAIAAFERTLITYDSPFDRYLNGDVNAISAAAREGYQLVQSVGCTSCHMGQNFSGPKLPQGTPNLRKFPTFPNTEYEKKYRLTEDTGRHQVTGQESDRYLWRVPTWRNIAINAPYFHNGSVKTLDEAVRVMAKTQLNRELPADQVRAVVAFLSSLTGQIPLIATPKLHETPGKSIL